MAEQLWTSAAGGDLCAEAPACQVRLCLGEGEPCRQQTQGKALVGGLGLAEGGLGRPGAGRLACFPQRHASVEAGQPWRLEAVAQALSSVVGSSVHPLEVGRLFELLLMAVAAQRATLE